MTTIVFHSSSLGVTEYEENYSGLAGDFVANADGLFHTEGQADDGVLIVSSARMGINCDHGEKKRVPIEAYVQAESQSALECTVTTGGASYTYTENFRSDRTRRFIFGRGIRDSYLGFQLRNPDGQPFRIDRIQINTRDSAQRKVA